MRNAPTVSEGGPLNVETHFSPVGDGVVFLREHPSTGMFLKMPLSGGDCVDGVSQCGDALASAAVIGRYILIQWRLKHPKIVREELMSVGMPPPRCPKGLPANRRADVKKPLPSSSRPGVSSDR